jgi:hypothetical protein
VILQTLLCLTLGAGAVVSGTVTDRPQALPSQIWVQLLPGSTSELELAKPPTPPLRPSPTCQPVKDGAFQFESVPDEIYVVRAWEAAAPGPFFAERLGWSRVAVRGGKPPRPMALHFDKGLTLAGRVVDSQQRGLEGVSIHLARDSGRADDSLKSYAAAPRKSPVAVSGPDGRFEVFHLRKQRLVVLASRKGFAQASLTRAEPGGPAPEIAMRTLTALKARVLNERGEPVSSFKARLEPGPWQSFASGELELPVEKEGEVTLRVSAADLADLCRVARVKAGQIATLPDLAMSAGHTVRIEVVDAASNDPIHDGVVRLLGTTRRQNEGVALFEQALQRAVVEAPHLPFEPLRLQVSVPGLAPLSRLLRPEETDVSIMLSTGVILGGVVRDASGAPVAGVVVAGEQKVDGPSRQSTVTDAKGGFRLAGFLGGPATIWLTGKETWHRALLFPAPVDLALPDKGEVSLEAALAHRH